MDRRIWRTRPREQCGMLLIEAMIAVFLFSLGVLALVGLQAAMTRNVTESKLRGEASFLANELIGQLWLDQANLDKYAIADGACADAAHAPCNAWREKVGRQLPRGAATVTVDGTRVSIELTWQVADGVPARFEIDASVTN